MSISANYSAIIQKNLPQKRQDSGSFTIPWTIGNFEFGKDLCDFGENINLMPLLVVKRLSLGGLTPTTMSLQMVECQWLNLKASWKMCCSRWESSFFKLTLL